MTGEYEVRADPVWHALPASGVNVQTLREVERLAQLSPWSWDVERDVLWCLPELFEVHGMLLRDGVTDEHGLVAMPMSEWLSILSEDDASAVAAFTQKVLDTGDGGQIEYRVERGDSVRWLSIFAAVAEQRDGRVLKAFGYTQDVTARINAEESVRLAERRLHRQQQVLDWISSGQSLEDALDTLCRDVERELEGVRSSILLVDRAAGVLRFAAAPTMGREYAEVIDGIAIGEAMGTCGTAAARGEVVIVEDTYADPLTNWFPEQLVKFQYGAIWALPLKTLAGQVVGVMTVCRTVPHRPSAAEIELVTSIGTLATLAIERDSLEAERGNAANVDVVTGLPNRVRLVELVAEHLASDAGSVAVLSLEVDRFKQLSSDLGHFASDRLVNQIAARLKEVIGDSGRIARYSGDQFAVMVPVTDPVALDQLAERVLRAFDTPINVDGGDFFLAATLGVAIGSGDVDAYGLVGDSLTAMHAAREEGASRRRVYDRSLRADAIGRITKETELRRAIDDGQLVMRYQPIFDFEQHDWTRAEALVRWEHPDRGLVPPDEFIGLAERTGLIVPLGERVLEMVLAQARVWSERLPLLSVSVNVSGMQLANPAFADYLLSMIGDARLEADQIPIEVTESAVVQDLETVRSVLRQLREAGMRIVIDDFGTGYSSLARLGELPITGLKIDRRFLVGLGSDPKATAVVHAVCELASAHGLYVVAEGIEDAQTLAAIEALGCRFAQGYYLSRPVPADEVELLVTGPLPAELATSSRRRA